MWVTATQRRAIREKLKDAVCSDFAPVEKGRRERRGVDAASPLLTSVHLAEPGRARRTWLLAFVGFGKLQACDVWTPTVHAGPLKGAFHRVPFFFLPPSPPLTDCVNSHCDRKRLYTVSGQWLPTIARGTLLHVHNQCKPDFARAHQPS